MEEKVDEYHRFLEDVLRPQLEVRERELAAVRAEEAAVGRVEETLATLVDRRMGSLETVVDMGAGCGMRAEVESVSKVFVHVGLGFHVEMTLPEAQAWAVARREVIAADLDRRIRAVAETRAHIRVAMATIRELREPTVPED
ncbi:uncharacterized protein AMSG_05498 [Thecamonas trahens ATCC 50062]|uniref:Uncharacterized protein n=1 Tax=Thecamonas trahens ATCC 50062 TaxID=461836 RepID=A0A0L0DAW9_THETB|nr:hypothetical protein AMSG_05498 [Thecamonas trahens ATCC 50062]KNC49482.1 hypothetical protein AMSG_05498 [Thecamonas trahens ATCC 50062]|eukprot:XP_013757901.1 hypothetical protein AMSG_05498 [Thecamonas trahens ATCC 50062]